MYIKRCIISLALLLISIYARADKNNLPIEVVIGTADLIVVGKIAAVQNNTYSFNIAQTVKGKTTGTITVQMFQEWTCDTRYTKPYIGEELCLFLKRGAANNYWTIINGSTGEKPIVNDTIIPFGYYFLNHSLIPAKHKLSLPDFIKTIIEFNNCYTLISTDVYAYEKLAFKQLVNISRIEEFAKLNWVAKLIFDRMNYYTILTE